MKEPQARESLGPFHSHLSESSAYCALGGLEAGAPSPPMKPM